MLTEYSRIYQYWTDNPCSGGNKDLEFSWWRGKHVLEIGCGTGVDAKKFINSGAYYTGIDLTDSAVFQTMLRVNNRGIIRKMNAENLSFCSSNFELVYSWGVIHHAINPHKIISEIHRVLCPEGIFYFMFYNKNSWKYYIEIMFLRKILWWLHHPKYKKLRKECPYPTKEKWISWNTDNLGCPLSRVYTRKELADLLSCFSRVQFFTSMIPFNWFTIGWAVK